MQQELHIIEEETHLFWGLAILVCTGAGTYLLTGTFTSMDWNLFSIRQLCALFFFLISFIGIFKLSEPLYHFTFYSDEDMLNVDIKKGTILVDSLNIPLQNIAGLRFAPHTPRSSHEALFDFSRNFHLLLRLKDETSYHKMLDVKSANFTLKVDDIAHIMRFIKVRAPHIHIPSEQADYFNL